MYVIVDSYLLYTNIYVGFLWHTLYLNIYYIVYSYIIMFMHWSVDVVKRCYSTVWTIAVLGRDIRRYIRLINIPISQLYN